MQHDNINWFNYFLSGKKSRLTDGHIPAEKLYQKILDHSGEEAYCCYFDLDYSKLKVEYWPGEKDKDGKKIYVYQDQKTETINSKTKPQITFSKYDQAIARPAFNMVSFDFDSDNPQDSLDDVRKFVAWLDIDDIVIFFSGSKGFHVMVPFGYFGLEPSKELPYVLRDLAKLLKNTFPTLDTSIYNYNRKFRVPFTKHDKSGLYKTIIDKSWLDGTIEQIKTYSSSMEKRANWLPIETDREPLQILVNVLNESSRLSYEIETENAGTITAPSPFEAYPDKRCIKRMLESRCDSHGRNNAAMVLVNDFYRTGKTRQKCETHLQKWSSGNGLPLSEINEIISNIYDRQANYNFGCQSDIKSSFCTYLCPIYKKLDPDKRPQVLDMPESAFLRQEQQKRPKEFEIITRLLCSAFKCSYDEKTQSFNDDGNIIRQDKDLFRYHKGKWHHLKSDGINKIKATIGNYYSNLVDFKNIESTFKSFMIYCPAVPKGVNMFIPNPHCANFKNGTLHLIEKKSGKFELEFLEHNKLDYITFQINYDYSDDTSNQNTAFLDMLDRIFEGDDDRTDKINAIAEMFGASLIPYFPHLFYLYGVSGSGKSTVMLILRFLLGDGENISNVQPKDFNGFNMESMVGKLVNMVTDVDTRKAISDDIVKQIEDRVSLRISRKFQTDIVAPLPAVHIFGGNGLLKSFDGASHTFERRWSIIKFNKPHTGKSMRNFASVVFRENPEGVLNFALDGLRRIVKSQGYFANFSSNAAELQAWSEESDIVAQFLDSALNGELEFGGLVENDNCKIERKALWRLFSDWQDDSGFKYDGLSRIAFYRDIVAKGYELKTTSGKRYFSRLGESAALNAAPNTSDASARI